MKKTSYIFIVILFMFVGIVSWYVHFKTYIQQDTVSIHEFPKNFGVWTSKEIPISKGDYVLLETKNAFVREYTNDKGKKVRLFIVYSQNNRKVSHPPEICYVGGGVTILSKTPDLLIRNHGKEPISTMRLFMEQGNTEQIAHYWFKVGDSFTSNYWKQQILIAIKTLLGKPASSALIRVSSIVEEKDQKKAQDSIEEFALQMTPHLEKYLP